MCSIIRDMSTNNGTISLEIIIRILKFSLKQSRYYGNYEVFILQQAINSRAVGFLVSRLLEMKVPKVGRKI